MTLGEVLAHAGLLAPLDPDLAGQTVSGIEFDSRRVRPRNVFFAFPGARTDGRAFAAAAMSKGAVAVVSDLPPPPSFSGNWIGVAHGRRALAAASKTFFGAPDERLFIAAITGTNGKTTTSHALDSILQAAGWKTSLVGTIGYHIGSRPLPAVNTTPESLELFQILDESLREGVTHVVFENSSHAQELGRTFGIAIHTALFTNLTRDHLDFHGTMERYFEAKCRMFKPEGVHAPKGAVINSDDPWGHKIPLDSGTEVYWYGLSPEAPYHAANVSGGFDGLRFEIATPQGVYPVRSVLAGRINVYNILGAFCCGLSLGVDPETIARGIEHCPPVPGRFERIAMGQKFLVAVDYAHTDDAIKNVIAVARGLGQGRIITLFGCGGDRDRAKRPLMGKAAAEASDFIVLTSDNPRSEDPMRIIADVLPGITGYATPRLIEPDRETAIRAALHEARDGDAVLLTGKGCETYQVLADRTVDFDDREVARRVLQEMGYSG